MRPSYRIDSTNMSVTGSLGLLSRMGRTSIPSMPSSSTPTSKDEWRAQFRAYRQSLSGGTYEAYSSLIAHRVLSLATVAQAEMIHVYSPLRDRGEVDTRPLIAALRVREATLVMPVVTSFDPGTPTLEHRRYAGPYAMQTNRWGLREPVGTESVPPDVLDVVLVPTLGADRRGHRLGHGTGYYDAFLAEVTCPCVALVYDNCVVSSLPNDPHDVRMTTLVTERNVHNCLD